MENFISKAVRKFGNAPVLITGSNGYVGSELIKSLASNGARYLGIDKTKSREKRTLSFNLCNKRRLLSVLKKFKPAAIIHLGTHSALSYQYQFLSSFKEDSCALVNLLEAIQNQPQTKLVYFSSSYVYSGLPPRHPVDETSTLKCTHNFGIAKSFFEQLILKTHPNSVILRLSSIFGPGKYLHPNAVYNLVQESFSSRQVTVWGKGRRMMQYVYIQDVIHGILLSRQLAPGIYNLAGNEYVSVAETAKIITEILGSKLVFLKDKPEGMSLPFMKTAKLKQSFRNYAMMSLKNSLRKYINILQKNLT